MVRNPLIIKIFLSLLLCLSNPIQASDFFRLKMYFGLSLPKGHSVSLEEWKTFESQEITRFFDGFNVVDSVGYYKGRAERSKIVTIILTQKDIEKAKSLAKIYAKKFNQESVMIVIIPVAEWDFISPN